MFIVVILCVVLYVCSGMYVCTVHMCRNPRRLEDVSDPMKQELHMVVSHDVGSGN